MKRIITLISFLITFQSVFSQSISPRLWVNNTYHVFDSIIYFSNVNQHIDTTIFEVAETDSVTFELHHTNLYHNILLYGTVTPAEFFAPTTNFCTQNSAGIGQVQIQGTKIDYMPYLVTDEEFFCYEDEIFFFFYNYIFHDNIGNFELLHYIKLVRPQPLSVDEISLPKINIFPNPTTDRLTLEFKELKGVANISILNMYGNVVKVLADNSTLHQQTIDVSDLSEGVYFVSIKNDNEQLFTQKIVITR
jgi:hypothetical protein